MPGCRSEAPACRAAPLLASAGTFVSLSHAVDMLATACPREASGIAAYATASTLDPRPAPAASQAADAAGVTPRQRDAICALRRRYLANLGALAARRRSLTAALQVRRVFAAS